MHLPTLNNNLPPSRQFSRDKMLLKKTWLGKMLIAQIIEVELRVTGLLVVKIPKADYFHDKTKIFKGKSSSELFNAKNQGVEPFQITVRVQV